MKYACNIPDTRQIAPHNQRSTRMLTSCLGQRYLLATHGCGKLRRHRIWRGIFYALLLTLLTSAPGHTEVESPLNSDLIRQRFGNYQVGVLRQSATSRVANLFSVTSGRNVCRTLAVTHFIEPVDVALSDADAKIRAGESIGATLRAQGFEVSKRLIIATQGKSGSKFTALAADVVPGTALEINVYVLQAHNVSGSADYAVIAEAYHPEHTPPKLAMDTDKNAKTGLASTAEQALSDLLQQI